MATDIDAMIAFWRDGFGAEIAADLQFAGARNVFLRLGDGRIHLYDQPPRRAGAGTVHHLGVQTDELQISKNGGGACRATLQAFTTRASSARRRRARRPRT